MKEAQQPASCNKYRRLVAYSSVLPRTSKAHRILTGNRPQSATFIPPSVAKAPTISQKIKKYEHKNSLAHRKNFLFEKGDGG